MEKYPKEIVIEQPLWDFMEYCEVYSSAASSEKNAFEIHLALLLRKMIDENISGHNGGSLLRQAWKQLKALKEKIKSRNFKTFDNQIPIWKDIKSDLPEYWLDIEGIDEWFDKWEREFKKAVDGWATN
jgi:hypothetical protein